MTTHDKPPAYAFLGHPSSPPMTPGSRSHILFPPQTDHTSTLYKRISMAMLAQSPPLEFIKPTGQGHQFHFTRPQSRGPSSCPSTASGPACATSLPESEYEDSSDDESVEEEVRPARRVEHADFILEELSSSSEYDSEIEVVFPDHYEEAKSDNGKQRAEVNVFIKRFEDLRCDLDSSDEEEQQREQQRRYGRKKKRWSAGIFKRSHSQSVEGDSSYSDNDPLDDIDSSTRRLRRRVRGPRDRSSLLFEDRGFSNTNNIAEVEEPEDGVPFSQGPPSIPSDDGFTLDELPFWIVEEAMDFEVESS